MTTISRRDFLKLGGLALSGLAFSPFKAKFGMFDDRMLVRIASSAISVHSLPSDESRIVGQWFRDDIVTVYEEVVAETPAYNPVWYRVWGGFIHRAHLQRVQVLPNRPNAALEEGRRYLAQVTVPYSRAMRYSKFYGWAPRYRLYYDSTHWVEKLEEGPDGEPWYLVYDELTSEKYHVTAAHLRFISDEEIAPITPEIDYQDKRIEVDLTMQTFTAYEYEKEIFKTIISSGLLYVAPSDGGISTKTPTGTFQILEKKPSKHMGDGSLASDIEAYELPGVPWTCFFTGQGHAFHGTYWHENYGVPMSHGCINMRNEDAKWLYRWARPTHEGAEFYTRGYGTQVDIFYG